MRWLWFSQKIYDDVLIYFTRVGCHHGIIILNKSFWYAMFNLSFWWSESCKLLRVYSQLVFNSWMAFTSMKAAKPLCEICVFHSHGFMPRHPVSHCTLYRLVSCFKFCHHFVFCHSMIDFHDFSPEFLWISIPGSYHKISLDCNYGKNLSNRWFCLSIWPEMQLK